MFAPACITLGMARTRFRGKQALGHGIFTASGKTTAVVLVYVAFMRSDYAASVTIAHESAREIHVSTLKMQFVHLFAGTNDPVGSAF